MSTQTKHRAHFCMRPHKQCTAHFCILSHKQCTAHFCMRPHTQCTTHVGSKSNLFLLVSTRTNPPDLWLLSAIIVSHLGAVLHFAEIGHALQHTAHGLHRRNGGSTINNLRIVLNFTYLIAPRRYTKLPDSILSSQTVY